MSKSQRKTGVFIWILIALLIIIGLIIAVAFIEQQQVKKSIDNKYHALELPSQLIFQSSSWNVGNIDSGSSWTYEYSVQGERSSVFSVLENDLKKSGYSIDFASDQKSEDYITARNTSNKLYLTIELLPNPPSSQAAPPQLKSVQINAEELPK